MLAKFIMESHLSHSTAQCRARNTSPLEAELTTRSSCPWVLRPAEARNHGRSHAMTAGHEPAVVCRFYICTFGVLNHHRGLAAMLKTTWKDNKVWLSSSKERVRSWHSRERRASHPMEPRCCQLPGKHSHMRGYWQEQQRPGSAKLLAKTVRLWKNDRAAELLRPAPQEQIPNGGTVRYV